jgi:hypothetical protein
MTLSDFDNRQADWKKREGERTVKLIEARGRVTGNIKTNDEVRVRIDKVEPLSFRSPVDLKNGDSIRIIIEKV